MTAPIRPSMDEILAGIYDRPSMEEVLASVEHADPLKIPGRAGVEARQRESKSGRLRSRMERENRSDREIAEAETPGYRERLAGNLSNLIAEVPGARALTAGVASLFPGETYRDARQALERAESTTPTAVRIPARLTGAVASTLAIPGSPAMQGARYGVASGLLDDDPDNDFPERLNSAATKGTVGLVTGKVADKALKVGRTTVRALRAAKPDANVVARETARDVAAGPLYDKFRSVGDLGASPRLQKLLDLPIIRTALNTVKGESDELVDLADTDARVLDAVYKRIGDKAFRLKHGYGPSTARDALAAEMDNLSGGLYSPALEAFGTGSAGMKAVERGAQTLANAASKGGSKTLKGNLTRSPAATAKWATKATTTEAEKQAAREGVLGQVGREPLVEWGQVGGTRVLPMPSRTLRSAPKVLESLGDKPNDFLSLLRALMASQASQAVP